LWSGGIPVRWQTVWIRPWHTGVSLIPLPGTWSGLYDWPFSSVDNEVLAPHAALRQRCDDLRPKVVFDRSRVVIGVVEREATCVADAVVDQSGRNC
jgi:hypothetical protein